VKGLKMKATLTAYPAYGRVYPTSDKLIEDFLKGKDFSTSTRGGPYFSIRDFTEEDTLKDFDQVHIQQPNPRLNVVITRRMMCVVKLAKEIRRSILESPKDSPVQEKP